VTGTTVAPRRIIDGTKFGFFVVTIVRSTKRYSAAPATSTTSHAHRRPELLMSASLP
jgi:hypothetical protein